MLISIECLVDLISEKAAVAERHPGRSIVWLQVCHVLVVLNRQLVVTTGRAKLCELAEVLESQQRGRVSLRVLLHRGNVVDIVLCALLRALVLLLHVDELIHKMVLVLILDISLWLVLGHLLHLELIVGQSTLVHLLLVLIHHELVALDLTAHLVVRLELRLSLDSVHVLLVGHHLLVC